tara:strand:+ start:3674 stop:3928 length:255 start_codon:yes stop_codon:yes gene_type:complete
MIITFDIPNPKLARINAALDSLGYVFDASSPLTAQQQKVQFFKGLTRDHWQSIVFNYERQLAIDNPNDSAAEQAKRFDGLSDIV